MTIPPPLAAGAAVSLLLWGGALILVLIVLGGALLWVRRNYHPSQGAPRQQDTGFTVAGLEDLRRRGQISDEEFRRLRLTALGLGEEPSGGENSSSSTPAEDDDGNRAADEDRPR